MNKMQLYDALFNQTSDCVAVLDLQGRLLAVNKKFEELHRWKHEEIVGEIIPMIPEESREGIFQMLQRIVHGEEISGIDIIMLRKDGSSFFANVSVFPLKNEMGEIIAFVGIGRDISENKKAQEILRKSEMLSVVGELAAGIAHEIRNPLTAIKGFMQLLKERNTNYVDIMLVEIERINSIVNEFMSLAKPHNINFVRINLNKLIEDVVLFMRPQAHLHGVAMVVDFTVDINEFKCEPNQLKQLFINIIKNAIEAMPNGGVVTLFVNRNGDGNVTIKVTDEGLGIPEDGLARLGEPFYSGKENGTGLGIVICHRIVEAHKGTLSFKSKLQQGTTVEINFPNV
ncbi:ATP-binding protein [Paenibacillus sp. LPE1-1-1.1]|uniref:ATP-binding protein n=1 Tax=Paenibacillus sp. LPE1-1-1.1 TaxID=3135230 RepID=UPI003432A2C3